MSNNIAYESLLSFRITKILMICSNYDAFALKEDGQIEAELRREYIDLDITNPPKFVWTSDSHSAKQVLKDNQDIDMIICLYNEHDNNAFTLAKELKESGSNIHFVMLMHYSKTIRKRIFEQDNTGIDYVFSWHGNADLILAIVKLIEDENNAEHDILQTGVQAILLAEDSVRYYSTYLPELYKLVLKQSHEFLKESLNYSQKRNRKRSRPKILLATCYNDAVSLFDKYKRNLLGVISDIGMIQSRDNPHEMEKLDAGIDFVKKIKDYDPYMPVLLQSSQGSMASVAEELGVGFLKKYSRTLFIDLPEYIRKEFGFGDLVFKDGKEKVYAKASNLHDLERIIPSLPDDILLNNTSKNMFSKWFFARGLFPIGERFRAVHHTIASEARSFLMDQLLSFHRESGQGILADFSKETYEDYIWFSRIGQGSLGGKARGLAFLNELVQKYSLSSMFEGLNISIPRTVVVATDWFEEFIVINGLQYVIDSELSDDEILSEFVASRLPEGLLEHLKVFLSTVNTPLAVRSSSKLEDSNWQPFAGVYSTYMIPCTENKDQMLRMLDKAIKSVYASVFYNGSRNYIQSTENLLSEEMMAVVVQSIIGTDHQGLYYPMMSGVARSVNFYPIGNEKAEDGIVNVAFGLGKTVVDGGQTLRFNPLRTRKILQLSDLTLARRDTQKMMYALDLRPGAFKISRNEGINLANIPVGDALKNYDYGNYVASTFSTIDNRLVPGVSAPGERIISFEAILKYAKFPVAKAIAKVMEICKEELANEVEIEFAVDVIPDTGGEQLSLSLLQVRPVNGYQGISKETADEVQAKLSDTLIVSNNALGAGYISGIDYVICIPPENFDNLKTREMAEEISKLNYQLKAQDKGYLLLGPGRWGSSDPFLGVPVEWSDISEARLIVEWGIPGFEMEPSQGTHFFQNITSLGVGYLTVGTVDGMVNAPLLDTLELSQEGKYCKVYKVKNVTAFIDRNTDKAIVGFQK